MINLQIAVVPGLAYGASTERFVRVGVGTESEERIHDALLVMKDLINTQKIVQDMKSLLGKDAAELFEAKV